MYIQWDWSESLLSSYSKYVLQRYSNFYWTPYTITGVVVSFVNNFFVDSSFRRRHIVDNSSVVDSLLSILISLTGTFCRKLISSTSTIRWHSFRQVFLQKFLRYLFQVVGSYGGITRNLWWEIRYVGNFNCLCFQENEK